MAIKVKTAAAAATAEEQNRTELSTRPLNVEGRKEEEKKVKKTARKPEIDAISSAQPSSAQLPILFFAASNLITTSTHWLLTACTAAADLLEREQVSLRKVSFLKREGKS